MRMLRDGGVAVEATTVRGEGSLHVSSLHGNVLAIEILISLMAPTNALTVYHFSLSLSLALSLSLLSLGHVHTHSLFFSRFLF